MNQSQRTFLIDKIKSNTRIAVKDLENSIPKRPRVQEFLLAKIMADDFEIADNDTIRSMIKGMTSTTQGRKDFLEAGGSSWRNDNEDATIEFNMETLFVLPEEFKQELMMYHEIAGNANAKIKAIELESDSLITRIQLASNKILDKLIQEVDDMGDISLINTQLTLIGSGKKDTPKIGSGG